jgi:cutinase
MRRARVLVGGVAIIVAAAVSAQGQAAALPARPGGAGCVDDFLIGSRGSGQFPPGGDQYDGLGPEVFQFSQRFAADMTRAGHSYRYLANPYPAVAVSPGGNSDGWIFNLAGVITGLPIGKYDSSVAAGVSGLTAEVRSVIATCPDTRIMLAGYSQGAQVTGDAYQQLTEAERGYVLGAFLLSDPRRDPADFNVNYGSARTAGNGAVTKDARPMFAVSMPGRVRSYCQTGDPVCEGPFTLSLFGLVINNDVSKHANYTSYQTQCGTYPQQAADYFAGLAGMRQDSAGPAATLSAPALAEAGVPVVISAGSSCDAAGEPLSFSWKVDQTAAEGDGPEFRPVFRTAGLHLVQVTVTNTQSESATATALVLVTGPGAYTGVPGTPEHVQSTPGASSATLTWDPPSAGPPAEGYLIYTASGDPVGDVGPGQPRSITIPATDLPLQVVVQAVNRVGPGGTSGPVSMTGS